VPIEHLVTIASNGCEDSFVNGLIERTAEELNKSKDEIINETKIKQIKQKYKSFSVKDITILIKRATNELYFYEWKLYLIRLIIIIFSALIITLSFETSVGKFDDCFTMGSVDNRSCFEIQSTDIMVGKNLSLLFVFLWVSQIIQCVISITGVQEKLKVFKNEHQNS
jgi:hypothetical protein